MATKRTSSRLETIKVIALTSGKCIERVKLHQGDGFELVLGPIRMPHAPRREKWYARLVRI